MRTPTGPGWPSGIPRFSPTTSSRTRLRQPRQGVLRMTAQLLGTVLGVVWSFGCGLLVYGAVKAAVGLRLSAEEEYEGADLSIHRIGATPEREASW